MKLPILTQRAVDGGNTLYPKSIRTASETPTKSTGLRVLKEAKDNTKLSGRSITRIVKGPKFFRGKHLYNLTLTERETCPFTCEQWSTCYGNHMPFAHRHSIGEELLQALEADLGYLDEKRPEGYVIRLHILGDFYSVDYVKFWATMVQMHPNMGVYGYTHREYGTAIGDEVAALHAAFPGRVAILRSDRKHIQDPLPGAFTVPSGTEPAEGIVVCPEQVYEDITCLNCGLCFNGRTSVQFLEH